MGGVCGLRGGLGRPVLELVVSSSLGGLGLFGSEASSSMPNSSEAGGPTGTIREPNSTPIVTSCDGEKRPSQRRMVS